MSALITTPYSYTFDETVIVRASASNDFGFGLTSAVNSAGGKIRQAPDTMTDPTVVSLSSTSITI